MGIYNFKEEDAYSYASHMRAKTKVMGHNLHFEQCPYCNGGSGSRRDKYTFAIDLCTGAFNCLRGSCGRTGNMITLSKDFGFSLGHDTDIYYSQSKKKYREFKRQEKPIVPKPAAIEYLHGRGISEKTAAKYQITTHKDNDNVLVFPFMDEKGVMQFIKYRKTNFNPQKDNNKEWCEPNCKPILFGMYQCDLGNKTLILTEGQIDSLSVVESGLENAVSVPTGKNGFTWYPYCFDWLKNFDTLIVFGDCERGEITLLDDMKCRFDGVVKVVRQQDYKGCKDANELLQKHGKQAVIDAIKAAVIVPHKQIVGLSDVKAVDLLKLPKIPTGIKGIDKVLNGGIYAGQVVIVSGKRGDGKSTLASQLFANALQYGKRVFAYSGELADYHFKNWLDMQLAGKRNISKRENNGTYDSYFLHNSTIERINDWYRERAYIFCNTIVDDEELNDVLDTIEIAIKQYGIDFVLLDNLMTALDVSMDTDLYRAQSKFVDKLVKIAKRYSVVVVLVAHPRKNTFGRDDTDEIAGSADITNKVDVVMTYKRSKELPDTERMLSISKNRLTGKLAVGDKEIHLFYDSISKRISDNIVDFDFRYEWENDFREIPESEQYMIPFE